MKERRITIRNPPRGQISIDQRDVDTTIVCHWPISAEGSDEGDWLDLTLSVDSRSYMWAVRYLLERGKGVVETRDGNFVLESVGCQTRLHVTRNDPIATVTFLCDIPARTFGPDIDDG
jgi:hypothetical protein